MILMISDMNPKEESNSGFIFKPHTLYEQ